MKKITQIAQELLLEKQGEIAVDFTCGNGFDTLVLASHYKQVYAFDIQEEAMANTKERCKEHTNITYVLDSHEHATNYISNFDVGIFNCGYLPQGDKTITTSASTVIASIDAILPLLTRKGRIVIVLYPGFKEGQLEAVEVENYVSALSGKEYDVSKFIVLNRYKVPYILIIDKN